MEWILTFVRMTDHRVTFAIDISAFLYPAIASGARLPRFTISLLSAFT